MGWEVAEGPVVEAEWLNFDALNLGPDHPARTMQDTFWTEPADHHVVLRTHTSPVQARTMLTRKPPIYVVCPGRVFRTDEYDATHSPMFHQVEGLVVDEGITMAHLKGTLDHFAAALFGDGIDHALPAVVLPLHRAQRRGRPALLRLPRRRLGAACRTCRGEGWIEWGGCGVVNPRVLTACGVDPERYTGFAFGMGIDRTLMFRHGVEDLRDALRGRRPLHHRLRNGDLKTPRCVPLSWIREYVDLPADVTTEELAARLTALGLKLEAIEQPGARHHRPAGRRPGAHHGARAAEERQDHQLVHRRRRRRQRHRRAAGHRLRRPQLRASATSSSSSCPAACCPAASRSPRARPTATSRPA